MVKIIYECEHCGEQAENRRYMEDHEEECEYGYNPRRKSIPKFMNLCNR